MTQDPAALTFERDGALRLDGALTEVLLRALEDALAGVANGGAGARLHGIPSLRPLLAGAGHLGAIAAAKLQATVAPVRAILFDKTPEINWSLAWHQDRTIAVTRRIEVDGFGPWTTKSGLPHVEPPFEILAGMVTLRVHFDDVPATNAPLLIAPGSHRLGKIPAQAIGQAVGRCGIASCIAHRGDVWAYATPILHASTAAAAPARRRVLHVDYAGIGLPGGLAWLGI